jgi:hypothetical protein
LRSQNEVGASKSGKKYPHAINGGSRLTARRQRIGKQIAGGHPISLLPGDYFFRFSILISSKKVFRWFIGVSTGQKTRCKSSSSSFDKV